MPEDFLNNPTFIFPERISKGLDTEAVEAGRIPANTYILAPIEEVSRLAGLGHREKPQIVAIQNLESEKLELVSPLVVTIEAIEGGDYMVWSEDLDTWGEGRDESFAKQDFKTVLEESYFNLKKDKDKLGPALEEKWRKFNSMLREK